MRFDGELSFSVADRAAAAQDFGGIRHQRPLAVLRPASIKDVARIVSFARSAGLHVAARGRGHSTCGQAQAQDGIVVDMSSLAQVSGVTGRRLDAEAGATWKDVLEASLERRLMPPVLPDFLGLSVGGLIALGGIGYQTCRYGTVVDHIDRLTVVTGTGEVVECSRETSADLYHAARGGLGQFGIVVRARLRLIAAPRFIRFSRYIYTDVAPLLADLRRLARGSGQRFDTICAFGITNETAIVRDVMGEAARGLWFPPWTTRRLFVLQVGRYCRSKGEADDGRAPDALHSVPGVRHVWTERFGDFADRASGHLVYWKRAGLWEAPHPWLNVILSGAAAAQWLPGVLQSLDPLDPADGPIMIYPVVRRRSVPSMLRMPASAYALRVDVLRSVPRGGARVIDALMRANRRAYAACVRLGGVQYPSAALDMRPADWRRHFGRAWARFERLRRRYDPDRVLAPGQGMITSTRSRG